MLNSTYDAMLNYASLPPSKFCKWPRIKNKYWEDSIGTCLWSRESWLWLRNKEMKLLSVSPFNSALLLWLPRLGFGLRFSRNFPYWWLTPLSGNNFENWPISLYGYNALYGKTRSRWLIWSQWVVLRVSLKNIKFLGNWVSLRGPMDILNILGIWIPPYGIPFYGKTQ